MTTDRGQYVLIAELTPPPLSERIPGDLLWTLKLGTIFSAIICLLIAHYLTKPIERLRDATHELARGNLDIRAGENLGNRHDEIADLVRDFDTMAGELRNQIQSERNLLSGVSHELRSPIARIRLALTLARDADDPERVEMLDRIEQDTIQLDSMLERILTVARLESGQQKPKFEPLSLNDVMDDVLHDATFEAAATEATINYQNSGEIKVNGDAALLRSAVENIVRNAVFYSGQGGKIDVSLETDERRGRDFAFATTGRAFRKMRCHCCSSRSTGSTIRAEPTPAAWDWDWRSCAMPRPSTGAACRQEMCSPHGLEVELRLPMTPTPAGRRSSGEVRLAQV